MITVKTNLKAVVGNLATKLGKLNDPQFLRPVAIAMIPTIAIRIHKNGLDSAGNKIGKYSNSYLKLRQRKYHRTGDPDVIISLTRQLENDYAVIATPKGYGIGFNNILNYNKSTWVTETYGKPIFKLTADEKAISVQIITDLANQALK